MINYFLITKLILAKVAIITLSITMSSKRSICTVVFILALSQLMYAQNYSRVQIGGGTSFNHLTTGILSNWGDGWTIGGGLSHSLNPQIDLTMNVSYSSYPYHGGNLQLIAPQVAGYRMNVSGMPTSIIEASVSARFSSSPLFIKPFLSLTTGLYRINIGEIILSYWLEKSPQNVSYHTYNGSGKSTTNVFAALGAGISIQLTSKLRLIIEGRYSQTFDSKEVFLPLLTAVQFDL